MINGRRSWEVVELIFLSVLAILLAMISPVGDFLSVISSVVMMMMMMMAPCKIWTFLALFSWLVVTFHNRYNVRLEVSSWLMTDGGGGGDNLWTSFLLFSFSLSLSLWIASSLNDFIIFLAFSLKDGYDEPDFFTFFPAHFIHNWFSAAAAILFFSYPALSLDHDQTFFVHSFVIFFWRIFLLFCCLSIFPFFSSCLG